jgi:hypothetical protein
MGAGSVLWTETPDDDRDETDEIEAHGRVDESFAARRLRYWLRGMFGGKQAQQDEPPEREPEE